MFVNLITNAISFCEEGDAVRVWARRRENRVLVVVEDTGPGIPEQALTKVFKRFYSERPQAEFGNHSGLGLAISKQIVEAHGGVIWAENIRPTACRPDLRPAGRALRRRPAGVTAADRPRLTAACHLRGASDGRGLLILGPSGAGKSALALQLIALGARLVADDRTDRDRARRRV